MSLFQTGRIVQTSGIHFARANSEEFDAFIQDCLRRHISGDWGDTCEEDAELNDESVKAEQEGKPTDDIMSSFRIDDETAVWIKTEWDRSVTTVLFADEY